jgi:cbb3-type cytochrome c oxidase subunit III
MLPRPSDLTAGRYSNHLMADAVRRGVRGTAMPAFPTLSQADVRDLVAYTDRFAAEDESASPAGSLAEAKTLYQTNCASCHGADGLGDGPGAAPLARVPADFHAHQPTVARAAETIANGVPGTAMPAWKAKLSEPQRQALAEYVRTFYETGRR